MMMKSIGNSGNITIMHNGKPLTLNTLNLQNKVIDECYVKTAQENAAGYSLKRMQLPIRMSIERAKRYIAMNKLGEFYAAL